jgi:hypothetical protein
VALKKTDDDGEPAAWCWTKDEALLTLRDEQGALEARLSQLQDEEQGRRQEMEASGENVARAHAIAAAGGKIDLAGEEKALAAATLAHQKARGGVYITREKLASVRARLPQVTAQAQARSRAVFRSSYMRDSKILAERLLDARAVVQKLERTWRAAEDSFRWNSDEARAHGQAAGLNGQHGTAPHAASWNLLPNDSRPKTGAFEDWCKELQRALGSDALAVKE